MRAASAFDLTICGAPTCARHTAMSITMNITTFPPSDPLTWKQADTDVFVATRDGEFAGFVEFDGVVHLVRDERGTDLGSFAELDDARLELESAQKARADEPRASRPGRALGGRRRPRRARV
jgi:hypothetical protein